MFDPRERLNRFRSGVGELAKAIPDTTNAMLGFIGTAQSKGVLTFREKELIALGVSIYTRCEDCIVVHVYKSFEAGITREEMLEIAGVSLTFGGGPSLGATASLVLAAINEFEKDFKN